MTIPQWTLLFCALWTISVPLGAVGWYRLGRVFRGVAAMNDFPSDQVAGADWYRRAMRAHANCVENLPVLAALVLIITALHIESALVNALALVILPARFFQSLIHIFSTETARAVTLRFSAFLVQLAAMFGLACEALRHTS